MFRTAVTQCAFGSPRMAIPGEVGVGSDLYLIVPPNPLNQKRAPHPGNARPSHQPLRLRTPSTDSSVLPTPPPLLLSGPGSPVSCPSFFGSKQRHNLCLNQTIPPTNRLVSSSSFKIYFYGHADSVRCAVASLRSVCPLDGCRTEDGAVHRVCIIAGSTTSLHGQYSTSSPIHSVASSCVVPLNDSAFSVPDSGSTSDCITTHSTVSSCLLPPQADRTSAAVRSTVGAALSTQTGSSSLKPEHCLRILIYSSVTQVLELEGSADSFSSVICSGPSFQDTHAAKPPFHMVLLWLPHSHENEAMLNDLIVHGLSLSSRLNVPFLSACDEYNRQLLDHLVKIVSSSGSSSSFLVGTDPCRARGINWTSFPGVLAIPCLTQLLDPASNIELKLTSLPNAVPLKTVKLLAALVNIGPPLNTPISDFPQSNCVGMQQTAACHSLFLPPTVTAPTAVKAEPPSFSRRRFGSDGPDNSFFQPAWLITMDELLEFLSQDHSGTSPNYAVIIHYLASGWSEIQNELQGFLKFLLDLCAPVGSLSAQTATHLPAHVMLVAIQNETFPKDGGSDATVIGISSGRTCLQTLAVTHDFNFQIWDDLRGEGKIERNHDETASVACAGTLPKTSTGPTIMQSSRSGCCKPCLSFMSVSLKDSTGSEMYQRALGGDPNFWTVAVKSPKTSLVIGHPDSIDRRSGAQISGGIICHQTFDTNFKPQKCKIIFPTNMADMVYSIESVGHKQQESQQQYNPNSTIFGGSDRRHGSNRVELPWLPPAPNIALHTSLPATSLVRSAPECSCVLQTSPSPLTLSATQQLSTWPSRHQNREEIDTQPVIPNIPHSLSSDSYFELNPQITQPSILSAPEAQSSVEEYYAELPKVTHPPGAGSEQHQQRRLNRPKRPRPRTSSSYTSSSSSRSPTPDPCDSQWITTQSSFVMRSPPSRSTPNAQHGQHSASSSAAVSDRVDGESALYAEVDDAVFAIKQATQDTAGLNGPRSVVYGETSFNIPCLRVPSNHAQLLPPVVPTGPIPYRLTCLGSNLPPPPTAQPAFASTRDPSQIDDPASSDVSQRGSSFSHSNYHSSPPTGADGLSHCIIPEDSLSSLVPDSDQLNSFSANHNQFSSGCEIGPSTYSNSLSSKPEENRAPAESCTLSCVNPHMTQTSSTLETITSVFRRRGFWFRHSSNRHSHEQKA
ncbi:unnamed protein product [Calicophoron daubneyi]